MDEKKLDEWLHQKFEKEKTSIPASLEKSIDQALNDLPEIHPKAPRRFSKAFTYWLTGVACALFFVLILSFNQGDEQSAGQGYDQLPINNEQLQSLLVEEIKPLPVENIETIDAVLQNALTGPSDELKQMLESEGLEDLVQYDENRFKDYFADETSYLEFANSYGAALMITPFRNEYTLKVENIEYEKTDSKEVIYNFTVDLLYQKESSKESKVEIVKGQVNLNEEHKIEDMLIRIEDFLNSLDKK